MKEDFRNKSVTIIGLARSGVAAALAVKECGAKVFGSDNGRPSENRLAPLSDAKVEFETGGHTEKALRADIIVVSPGVPLNSAILTDAKKKGIRIIGEMELAYLMTAADIIGITGSNGKSTTTALLGELLKNGPFKTRVGGNIGDALTGELVGMVKGDVLVAEISSFQLDSTKDFRPKAAVILNLTPDHLDRYNTADDYYMSKMSITKNQVSGDLLVMNDDDPISLVQKKSLKTQADLALFSLWHEVRHGAFVRNNKIVVRGKSHEKEIMKADEVGLIGLHNLSNILAAVVIADAFGITEHDIKETLKSFKGIEHRIEFVRTLNGVSYYNDSKGTNVDSVKWALLGLKKGIHLIAGGRDKEGDFSALNEIIKDKVSAIYAIGEAAPKMKKAWGKITLFNMHKNMEDAVTAAFKAAKEGETVLLSPACASFDMYRNYEERGRDFKKIVGAL